MAVVARPRNSIKPDREKERERERESGAVVGSVPLSHCVCTVGTESRQSSSSSSDDFTRGVSIRPPDAAACVHYNPDISLVLAEGEKRRERERERMRLRRMRSSSSDISNSNDELPLLRRC